MPLDKARLAKVLALTQSDNDSEALAAIRKANDIVRGAELTWEDVLVQQNSVHIVLQRQPMQETYKADDSWIAPHLRDKVTIDLMFRAVYSQPRTGNEDFWRFLDSINQWYVSKGFLTAKQYSALKLAYKKVTAPAS